MAIEINKVNHFRLYESREEAEKWLDKRGDGLYWDLLAREILASK